MRVARIASGLGGLATGVVLVAACATSSHPVGAPTSSPANRPTIVGAESVPSLVPRVLPTEHSSPSVETDVEQLTVRIDHALALDGNAAPGARLSRKAAAGDQVLVRWDLGRQAPDARIRERVRVDAVHVLDLVQRSGVHYGSVLLLVTGASIVKGKRTVSVVVRAKYTHGLVARTDWAMVSAKNILGMCDDKPAVIARDYR